METPMSGVQAMDAIRENKKSKILSVQRRKFCG